MSHVLVTGGASGIGAGVAQHLAAHGTRVSVLDRTGPEHCEWWAKLPEAGRARWATADVADTDALDAALSDLVTGGISGLVAYAGISVKESLLDSGRESWTDTIWVNVLGTAFTCHRVAHALVEAGRGRAIVLVASTVSNGYVAVLGADCHALKGAIAALTRALAGELGCFDIRVNAVAPGLVRTPLTEYMRRTQGEEVLTSRVPLRTKSDPADVAEAVMFLLSPDASMITGQLLPVDAGQLTVAGQPLGGFPTSSLLLRGPDQRKRKAIS